MKIREIILEILRLPKRNIYDFAFPFMLYLKIFNFYHYSSKGNPADGILVRTKYDKIFMWINCIIQIGMIYWAINEEFNDTTIPALDQGNHYHTVLSAIFVFTSFLVSIRKHERMVKLFKLIHEFDARVSIFNYV